MTSHQEDKVTSATTTQKTCNRYSTVIAQIPAFVTALGDAAVKIQYIQDQAKIQAGKTGGITLNKKELKKAMCKKAFELSSAAASYAATAKDTVLAGKVSFTLTELLETRDAEVAGLCDNIRTEATNNLAKLGDYAVVAADLTSLAQKIDDYKNALAAPADARVAKSRSTDNIAAGFVELDDIQDNRMDTLMPKFEAISPDFVKDYKNSRIIVDSGGGGPTPPIPPSPPPPPPGP